MRNLRTDIQVLRAIAVLSVLIFHFDLPGLHKGFLGVDIFFVISGYLMSRVIIDEMDDGRFSAASFYFRRARRLLPAALATFTLVTLAAPWTMTVSALGDYGEQLLGALGFAANIVLWRQSGYFEEHAALKPLLHTWSLSLEEQYYFVLPLTLALLGRRWRGAGLVTLLAGSLLASQWWLRSDPSAAFYLLPFRAWELLIGSVCALPGVTRGWTDAADKPSPSWDSAWVGLPLIAIALIWGVDDRHPRWDAMLVCLGTSMLIVRPSALLQSTRAWTRPLRWAGDQSYSLYLVHWPLIALARHVWPQSVPTWVSLSLLPLSFGLAQLSYTFVEQPFRRIATPGLLARRLAWLALALVVASAMTWWHRQQALHERDWPALRRINYGFSADCEYDMDFQPRAACANAPAPRTMVWGDSYAMHIVPALEASAPPGGIMQATRSACSPLLNHARQVASDPPQRGLQCLSFNRSVLAYLRAHPRIEYVVLSSRWQYLFDEAVVDARGRRVHPEAGELVADARLVINALRAMGKKVVIVSPPALLGPDVDLGLCTERHAQGLLTVLPLTEGDCSFRLADHERRQREVLVFLKALSQAADVEVIGLEAFNCHQRRCTTMVDGIPVYRDFGHLSVQGAQLLGTRLHLGNHIEKEAR